MSMELISRKEAIKQADYLCLETGYDNEKVEEMLKELPIVKAIPIEKLEQILSDIDIVKCGDWIATQTVRDMLHRAIKEVSE